MRRLLKRDEAPPVDNEDRSFRYVHRQTGHISYANDYYTWLQKISDHCTANGLPQVTEAEAEDQLCATLPPERCLHEAGDAPPVDIKFGFQDVGRWISSVAALLMGDGYVDQKEADRRAVICVACPYNVQVAGGCGGGCKKLVEFMTPGMLQRKTKYEEKLKSCAICKCFNRVQIHFPLDTLKSDGITNSSYPDWCWKR